MRKTNTSNLLSFIIKISTAENKLVFLIELNFEIKHNNTQSTKSGLYTTIMACATLTLPLLDFVFYF